MKKTTAILIISILLFCACQKTPEEITVRNKNNKELDNKINATELPEEMGFPQHLSEAVSTSDGYLDVIVDAEIVTPQAAQYPVIAIEPMEITQECADKIIASLIGGNVMYEKEYALTTDEITANLQAANKYIKDELSKYEKSAPDYYKRKYDSTIEWIKYLNELLPNSSNEKKEHSGKFQNMNGDLQSSDIEATRELLESKDYSEAEIEEMMANYTSQINSQQFICAAADLGKAKMASMEINKYSLKQQQVMFYNTQNGGTTGIDFERLKERPADAAYEQAAGKAKALVSEIGIEGMQIYKVGIAPNYDEDEAETGHMYKFIFARVFDGVPVSYVNETMYKMLDQSELYREPWKDERLEISVDEIGIIGFEWINPVRVNEMINSGVEILEFEEIKSIFLKQILINNAYRDEGNIASLGIVIDRITLGLAKVARQNTDGYMYVPAWDFFGTIKEEYKDDQGAYTDDRYGISFMTINAIDGSVINRSLGY